MTGESRAASYRTDYRRPGTFDQIQILHPLSAGGIGAWEFAVRLCELNLNSGGFLVRQPLGLPSNIQGGRETDMTIGLNWYPDIGIRFMANWIRVLQLAAPYNALSYNGIHPNISGLLVRFRAVDRAFMLGIGSGGGLSGFALTGSITGQCDSRPPLTSHGSAFSHTLFLAYRLNLSSGGER